MERTSIDTDREKLETFARELRQHSEEVDTLCKVQQVHWLWGVSKVRGISVVLS